MSRNLTHLFPLLVAVLLATACSSPRKASERAKAKAQKHLALAMVLDPSIMRPNDQEVELPGDSATLPPAEYADADVDSILAACAQLAEALRNERDLFAHQLMRMPAHPVVPTPPPAPSAARKQAVDNLRKTACSYKPFTYDHELFLVTASGGSTPKTEVRLKPRKASVPGPPQAVLEPVLKVGVANWYRTGFWILLLISAVLVTIIARVIAVSMRTNTPHG
jgi:hypothetical protein